MKFSKNELIKFVSLSAGAIFSIVAFILFAAPFATGKTLGTTFSGFELTFNWDSGNNGLLFAGWLILLLLVIGEILELTLLVLEKAKIVKIPQTTNGKTMNLAFIVVELLLDIMAAIFIFVTIPVFGIGNLYNLGVGAILSGIFTILAGLCIAFGRGAKYFLK